MCVNGIPHPGGKEPVAPEYNLLKIRALSLFGDMWKIPVQEQSRRKLKKRSFGCEKSLWVEWIMFSLLSGIDSVDRDDISILNTAIYVVAAVFTYKEGQECVLSGGGGGGGGRKRRSTPNWQRRIESKL